MVMVMAMDKKDGALDVQIIVRKKAREGGRKRHGGGYIIHLAACLTSNPSHAVITAQENTSI